MQMLHVNFWTKPTSYETDRFQTCCRTGRPSCWAGWRGWGEPWQGCPSQPRSPTWHFFFLSFSIVILYFFSFPAHILLRIVTRGALTSSTHSSSSTYARSVSSSSFITWLEHWKTQLIGCRQGSAAPFRHKAKSWRFTGAQKYIRSHLNDKNKAEIRK